MEDVKKIRHGKFHKLAGLYKRQSKRMILCDYIIMGLLLILFIVCIYINQSYLKNTTLALIKSGKTDISNYSVTVPIDMSQISIVIGTWAAQLAVSTGAYYSMCKSDHRNETAMDYNKGLTEEEKSKVDPTQVLCALINMPDS